MPRVSKKQDIEKAAVQIFARKGTTATSMRDIAGQANVTEGALYRHFPGKAAMILELFQKCIEEVGKELEFFLTTSSTPGQGIERGIEFLFHYYSENPDKMIFLLFELHSFPEEDMYSHYNPTDIVQQFIKETLPDEDSVLLTALVLGMVSQVFILHRYSRLIFSDNTAGYVSEKVKKILGL